MLRYYDHIFLFLLINGEDIQHLRCAYDRDANQTNRREKLSYYNTFQAIFENNENRRRRHDVLIGVV